MSPAPSGMEVQNDRSRDGGLPAGVPAVDPHTRTIACVPAVDPDPRAWSDGDLAQWLVSRGLPPDIPRAFEAHLVNGLLAEDLSEVDLASMGITDALHQRRVTLELRQLFSQGGGAPAARSKTLHSDLGNSALIPPRTAASLCPPPPTARRTRPRPHSARLHTQHASAASLPMAAAGLPVKSSVRTEAVIKTQRLAELMNGANSGSSPYMQAVPRRPRPRSANSAMQAGPAMAATAPSTPIHTAAGPSLPPPRMPSSQRAIFTDMLVTPAVSSTAHPTQMAQSHPDSSAHRQRAAPPLLSHPRMGAPSAQAAERDIRQGNSAQALKRDMRLGIKALHASQGRVGGSTPAQDCRSETAGSGPSASDAVNEALRAAEGTAVTAVPQSWSAMAPPKEEPQYAQGQDVLEGPSGTTISETRQDIFGNQQALEGLQSQSINGMQMVAAVSEGLQVLALGGHNSVPDLLYERDSLAAALAAEQRRAGEFEQLWRRAEQELKELRASTDKSAAEAIAEQLRANKFEQLWRQGTRELKQLRNANESSTGATEHKALVALEATSATTSPTPSPQSHRHCSGCSVAALPAIRGQESLPPAGSWRPKASPAECLKQQVGQESRALALHASQNTALEKSDILEARVQSHCEPAEEPAIGKLHDEAAANFAAESLALQTQALIGEAMASFCDIDQGLANKAVAEHALARALVAEQVLEESQDTAPEHTPVGFPSGSRSAVHLDNLCREFRLQVRDMVAAAVNPMTPSSGALQGTGAAGAQP